MVTNSFSRLPMASVASASSSSHYSPRVCSCPSSANSHQLLSRVSECPCDLAQSTTEGYIHAKTKYDKIALHIRHRGGPGGRGIGCPMGWCDGGYICCRFTSPPMSPGPPDISFIFLRGGGGCCRGGAPMGPPILYIGAGCIPGA
jgi:hypothetical protein